MVDIGNYDVDTSHPEFQIEFSLEAADFNQEWVRCSMLANYVAQYSAYQFVRREWAENLISTVVNDFLESIIQLTPESGRFILRCLQLEDRFLLDVSHCLRPEILENYKNFLRDANAGNVESQYFQLLTTAERSAPSFNQLGLLMLIHDFGACLVARLDDVGGCVNSRVFISTKELTL